MYPQNIKKNANKKAKNYQQEKKQKMVMYNLNGKNNKKMEREEKGVKGNGENYNGLLRKK